MLTYDYFRQESIRSFIADSRRTGRPKAIILDGCVLLQDLLVIGLATRTSSTLEAIQMKHGKLRLLARFALTDPQDAPLLDCIVAITEVRNAAAHEPIADSEIEARFLKIWIPLSSGTAWPESLVTRSKYYRAFFSLLGFELGRWQVALPPSGYLAGDQPIDWSRFA